jgi:hypothetical protein
MTKQRYEDYEKVMHAEFPGDDAESKACRHSLYKLGYAFRAKDTSVVPVGAAVENLVAAAVENSGAAKNLTAAEKLEKVQKIVSSLKNDRLQRINLAQLVETVIKGGFLGITGLKAVDPIQAPFSAHDVTKAVRTLINNSRVELLDDRPFELVDILGDGNTSLTQNIPHSEVRGLVHDLMTKNQGFSKKVVRTGQGNFSHFEYDKMKVDLLGSSVPGGANKQFVSVTRIKATNPGASDNAPTPAGAQLPSMSVHSRLIRKFSK